MAYPTRAERMRAKLSHMSVFARKKSIWDRITLGAIYAIGIAAIGYLLVQHYTTKPTNPAANTTQAAQMTTSGQQTNATTQAQQPAATYLSIKEWGVKLPLSANVEDAYYTTEGSNTGADGLPNTAWLGISSLNNTGCNIGATGPTAKATPIGSIIRVLPTEHDPVKQTPYTQLYPNGVMINGYYYAFVPWKNQTCAPQATIQSIDSAFTTAAKSTASASATAN